jgi:hypothetical protein
MASTVSFNQDLLTSWVQLCDTLGTAQRSGENPNLVEGLRAQVAVSLVSLIQSSTSPISEEASQGLLSMLLEPADSSTWVIQDTMLENPETEPPEAETSESVTEEVNTPSINSEDELSK